jgi:hypothetical protein
MWQMAKDPEEVKAGTGAVEAAIFALMGLLIAFTFSGAASRFDTRRVQVVEEAVTIETVWQRIDLLPKEKQQVLRDDMRAYLDMRVAAFAGARIETIKNVRLSSEVRAKMWKDIVNTCKDDVHMVEAVNNMFNMATVRTMTASMHPPILIFVMLAVLLLAGSLLAGYHMGEGKHRNWFHIITFTSAIILTFYVILDFEFPHLGLIRIEEFYKVFTDLQQQMK